MTRETVAECRRHDQAICEDLMQEYPALGWALCSLFGVYRGSGIGRDEAYQIVRQTATPAEEQP